MFKVLLVALSLIAFSNTVYAKECSEGVLSKEAFLDKMVDQYEIYTLQPDAMTKLISHVNTIRTSAGADPFDKDVEFYFTLIEVNVNGVVWFSEGCVVAGSVTQLSSLVLSNAFESAGITTEDFVKYEKGKDV